MGDFKNENLRNGVHDADVTGLLAFLPYLDLIN